MKLRQRAKCQLFPAFLGFFLLCSYIDAWGLDVKSTSFSDNQKMDVKYTGFGEDVSPQITWQGVPEGTKSFAIIMDDPDAPAGTWVHWVVYNIPSDVKGFDEAMPRNAFVGDGGTILQGINSFNRVGYYGPYPPPGNSHRYIFKVYALNSAERIPPGMNKDKLLNIIKGRVIDKGELTGIYGRE